MPVKEKIGIVVSNKMQKTVVVQVESRFEDFNTYNNIRIKKKWYIIIIINMKKTVKIIIYFFELNTLSDLEVNFLTFFCWSCNILRSIGDWDLLSRSKALRMLGLKWFVDWGLFSRWFKTTLIKISWQNAIWIV